MDNDKKEAIVEMYTARGEDGKPVSVTDICVDLAVYPPQVYQTLREKGIPLRKARVGKHTPEKVAELICALYLKNPNASAVSRATLRPYSEVLGVLKSKGVLAQRGKRMGPKKEVLDKKVSTRADLPETILEIATREGTTTADVLKQLGADVPPKELEALVRAAIEKLAAVIDPSVIDWDKVLNRKGPWDLTP